MDDRLGNTVFLCVNDDSASFIKWSLQQYRLPLKIAGCGKIGSAVQSRVTGGMNILIVEDSIMAESAISYLKRMRREHADLRIIMIVPPTIKKEQAVQIISERLVEGMLVQPFSTEVLWNYLDKISARKAS
ncbi:MAG TPA: hypothetical protein VK448_11900 [Dissulfurispiraceae bacterium]|nr:hypothetical protein [Dissulfurispiraceae bacterium]